MCSLHTHRVGDPADSDLNLEAQATPACIWLPKRLEHWVVLKNKTKKNNKHHLGKLGDYFSKVVYVEAFYRKDTRALTAEFSHTCVVG